MGLYERLTGEQSPRIPVHVMQALLGEMERGKLTAGQAATTLGLSPAEETEAATLLAKVVYPRECVTFGGAQTLTNVGTAYDNVQVGGAALVQTVGVTQAIFGVRVNKVGSGTQSWQLWNDTDGTEVAVIDDAGATGIKNLSTTVNFGSPLAAGMKVLRVRAKSTTTADDPQFLGAAVSIRRVELLTPLELHEVLLIADWRGSPYATATALKARLGIT